MDIDALQEITGKYINNDSEDRKKKSRYELYAEQMTPEEMENFSRLFKRNAKIHR